MKILRDDKKKFTFPKVPNKITTDTIKKESIER